MIDSRTQTAIKELRSDIGYEWAYIRRKEYLKDLMADHLCRAFHYRDIQEQAAINGDLLNMRLSREMVKRELGAVVSSLDELYYTKPQYEKQPRSQISDDMIARAREYPFEQLVTFDRAGFIPCPWHADKTPSLHKMRNANRLYCFSCHKSCDSIEWVMEREGLSFKDTVLKLC